MITIPDAPTRAGYTFQYWEGSKYYPGDQYQVEGDHTFTAKWQRNSTPASDPNPTPTPTPNPAATTYTISFDANGGTGVMAKQTVEKGKPVTLMANDFKRDGYTFAGWNTAADGTGTPYADKAEVKPTGDLKLYAQWSKGGQGNAIGTGAGSGTPATSTGTNGTATTTSTTSGGTTTTTTGGTSTTSSGTTSGGTSGTSSTSLATTADPTTVTTVCALALAGAGLVTAGARRRRRR